MMHESENFFMQKNEPLRSTLFTLRDIILKQDNDITSEWKYGMPFFCYKRKMFCYLWVRKKTKQPYIGIVEGNKINHPDLISEKRSRMKILLLNSDRELPLKIIENILQSALNLYKSGTVKIE